jgi:subtilisin family serine protease
MRELQNAFLDNFPSGFADWTTPAPPADSNSNGFVLAPNGAEIATGAPALAGAQQPDSTNATQTPAISVPAGASCTFRFRTGSIQAGDDRFSWALSLDGVKLIERIEPATSVIGTEAQQRRVGNFEVPATSSPHTVTVQFVFHRGIAGDANARVELFSIRLDCLAPTYAYLQGTSMATPHVTGTAGLLFSLKPSATVTQVRNALLTSVDPLPSLAGKTVTGGRLNAWKALAALVPMDTRIKSGPPNSDKSTNATFSFDTNNTGNAGFQCQLDTTPFAPCTSPQSYKSLTVGKHTFRVRSAVAGGVDTTPATSQWTVAKSK